MKILTPIQMLLCCVFALLLWACNEKQVDTYVDEPSIYFRYDTKIGQIEQTDFISQTFFGQSADRVEDTLTVHVMMSGFLSDADRPFRLKQANAGEAGAAIEGIHYAPFTDSHIVDSWKIKAGAVQAEAKIIIYKYENAENDPDNSLDLTSKTLLLEVDENDYFSLGVEQYRAFTITVTSMAAKPTNWDSMWKGYFGEWGTVKFQFIIEKTGFNDWDSSGVDVAYIFYVANLAKSTLDVYNAENPDNPLKEADGTLVVFP